MILNFIVATNNKLNKKAGPIKAFPLEAILISPGI